MREAAALVRTERGSAELVGYVVWEGGEGEAEHKAGLLATLRQQLPEYLVPGLLLELSALPRTPNGKLDRKALPVPQSSVTGSQEQPPQGATEQAVAEIWASVLGREPSGREVSFFASRGFPPVRLEIVRGDRRLHIQILQRGAESTPAPVGSASASSRGATFVRFVGLGFEHILPEGLDHVLFVLGLALFSSRLGPLLVQVTAFTVAHTLTLFLSTYGVVQLPPRVVEPLIALSIAYVAVENVLGSRLGVFRVLLVFAFGLLHGLGFAGVLAELGLPENDRLTALLAFNVGVELGQLAVILPAFAAIAALARAGVARRLVVVPASLAIGAMGLYWTIARLLS